MANPFVGLAVKILTAVLFPDRPEKPPAGAVVGKCGKCGRELSAGYAYCPECGVAVKG